MSVTETVVRQHLHIITNIYFIREEEETKIGVKYNFIIFIGPRINV